MNNEKFERDVLPAVLANEVTCRLFLKEIENKGTKFSKPIESLTLKECQTLAIKIYARISYEEKAALGESEK